MSIVLVAMRNTDKNMAKLRLSSFLGLWFWSVCLLAYHAQAAKGGGGSVLVLWFWSVYLLAYHDQTVKGGGESVLCAVGVIGVLDKKRCFWCIHTMSVVVLSFIDSSVQSKEAEFASPGQGSTVFFFSLFKLG